MCMKTQSSRRGRRAWGMEHGAWGTAHDALEGMVHEGDGDVVAVVAARVRMKKRHAAHEFSPAGQVHSPPRSLPRLPHRNGRSSTWHVPAAVVPADPVATAGLAKTFSKPPTL